MAYPHGGGPGWTPPHGYLGPEEDLPPDYDMDVSPGPQHHGHPYAAPHDPYAAGGRRAEEEPSYPAFHQPSHHHYYHHRRSGSGEFDNPGFQMEPPPPPPDHHRRPSPSPGHQRTRSEGLRPEFLDMEGVERQQRVEEEEARQGAHNRSFHGERNFRRRHTSRHRRSGRYRRRGEGDDHRNDDDDDADSVNTLRREDLQRALDFLATIRIKRRTRKSVKRMTSNRSEDADRSREGREEMDDDEDEEEYEEVRGMPSTRALDKSKTLTERLQELQEASKEEVAMTLREKYADFDPSIMASAAWKGWSKKRAQMSDVWAQFDIWASHFKEIEGRFGNATASYFRFTRWLVFLNFFTFLISFCFVVVPFFSSASPGTFLPGLDLADPQPPVNASRFVGTAINCTATYTTSMDNFTASEAVQDKVLDFFVGTGWMEQTSMFYGHYHNRTFPSGYNYNMGLAYILSIGVTFLISFFLILVNSSSSVKQTVVDEEQSTVHFTNSVICGWDYCILDVKSAQNKKSILCQELKADLLQQSKRLQRENQTYQERVKLYLVRFAINFFVLCMLGGCIYLIYFTTSRLLDLRDETTDQVLFLIIQLLPSLTITFLNFLVPLIFNALVQLEDYWPAFELKITLLRTVFLRLSSLGVLTFTLYYTLLWPNNKGDFFCGEEGVVDNRCCGNFLWEGQKKQVNGTTVDSENRALTAVQCWETYIGQQFYKLALVDFAALIVITFFVEFPRKFLYERLKGKIAFVGKYGQQEFDIPQNVLDIVYSQTLSWLGTFFAPLLPAMTLLKVFFIFYIKKLTLMKNFAPPQNVYKVSRSNSFFNLILLISFIIVAVIVGYMLGNINPSKSCGPYRLYSTEDYVTWTALTDVIAGWPNWASTIFFFFGTTAFYVPCFILLCLLMYYYWAVGQGYKRRDEILKEQLRLEGKDKHYLLARVNDIIKQGSLQGMTSPRA
ncbi:transmembrane channel-like protein 7 isoform X1 [Babylonia areolata]|uniref:transmembrane channel-like protein 7 isoform X1 n=1 Tax=Babylonia areolata TaxID=304850 RepID=UPI003FD3EAF2